MTIDAVPSRIWKSRSSPPQRGPPTSTNRLGLITMRFVGWLGLLLSRPWMMTPEVEPRTTLLAKVTSSTTDHGARRPGCER
jgi:hypothetical protein